MSEEAFMTEKFGYLMEPLELLQETQRMMFTQSPYGREIRDRLSCFVRDVLTGYYTITKTNTTNGSNH